jgi:hypothetical protein
MSNVVLFLETDYAIFGLQQTPKTRDGAAGFSRVSQFSQQFSQQFSHKMKRSSYSDAVPSLGVKRY